MSSNDAAVIAGLDAFRVQSNRYLTTVTFIIGVLGNLLNVIVFSQPTLNKVPTARYFIAASGASLASLTSGLLGRIFAGWAADPASRNTALCKVEAYTNKLGQTSCSYFLLAAAIDRWLQSNRNINSRQMSSVKNSTRVIILILLVFGSYHSIHAVCYEAFLLIPPIRCYADSITCRYFETISYAVVTVLIPQLMMLFFGWKTIRNIHHCQRRIDVLTIHNSTFNTNIFRIAPTGAANRVIHKTKIRSLTRMLIVQVFANILLTLPATAQAFYTLLTLMNTTLTESNLQLAIGRFLFAFTMVLSYLAISLLFYLYTLTGSIFRQTLFKMLTKLKCCLVHR
jgi:hypothetical protein